MRSKYSLLSDVTGGCCCYCGGPSWSETSSGRSSAGTPTQPPTSNLTLPFVIELDLAKSLYEKELKARFTSEFLPRADAAERLVLFGVSLNAANFRGRRIPKLEKGCLKVVYEETCRTHKPHSLAIIEVYFVILIGVELSCNPSVSLFGRVVCIYCQPCSFLSSNFQSFSFIGSLLDESSTAREYATSLRDFVAFIASSQSEHAKAIKP